MAKKIRVLIIDDSALVRKLLTIGLSHDPEIEVIGAARDPYAAADIINRDPPDVITLDIEMPQMDGVTFLEKLMAQYPIPTVVVSSLAEEGKKVTLDALAAGAVSIVAKPRLGIEDGINVMMGEITERVKEAAKMMVRPIVRKTPTKITSARAAEAEADYALSETTDRVIAIGASAGGVAALANIMPLFPANSPGIVIVMHMPAGFTAAFAERLNNISTVQVKEAKHNDRIHSGLALLAPGGEKHMEVYRSGGEYKVRLIAGEKISRHIPSVDALFNSVAERVGQNAAAALLTGMGDDGARGLLHIRQAGGRTLAQDEASSTVYGMPQVAWEIGAAEKQVSLLDIPAELIRFTRKGKSAN